MAFRHPIYDDETEALRAQIRRFCEKEILLHMEAWKRLVKCRGLSTKRRPRPAL